MFEDRMITTAIPERVYALCLAVKNKEMQESDLKELLEPSGLGGTTKYFETVRDAARELGLISVKEGDISLAVDPKNIVSYEALRAYMIENIELISSSLFFAVSKEYLALNETIFKYKSVSEAGMVEYMSKAIGVSVYEDDMRAWRFWASFLGLGHLHDMILLPNMYQYLKTMLKVVNLKKNQEYSFTEFVAAIRLYTEIGLVNLDDSRKLNMAFSNGLRALHDEGVIQLSHRLDSGDMWFLYEAELHAIRSTVTHVTVGGRI